MQKTQIQKDHRISSSSSGKYMLWLFIGVVVISVVSLVSSAFGFERSFAVTLLDSINRSETVYFDYGKYELKEETYFLVDKIAEFMKEDSTLKLQITGHTDDRGSEEFNLELSMKRANAVRDYLISKGVSAENISVAAKGKNEPVNGNSDNNQRALNRRVEFSLVSIGTNKVKEAPSNTLQRRSYADGTLIDQSVNSHVKINSREEISAEVLVRDSAGVPVDSLKENDISAVLKWDSEGQMDSTEGTPRLIPINDKKKIAFSLTMDYSGSMYGVDDYDMHTPKSDKIIEMEKSVKQFINLMDDNMFCKIIKFGEKVLPPLRFTKSKSVLLSALENNSYPMGGTALYSSIYTALCDTTFQSNPVVMKTIIAFTDGMENSSVKVTLDSIYRRSMMTNTKVFTVGLYKDVGEYKPNETELARRRVDMLQIALRTGGFFYPADDETKLKEIYANIFKQVLSSYNISILWNSSKLPPKGTQVMAELRINVKGITKVVYKSYVME